MIKKITAMLTACALGVGVMCGGSAGNRVTPVCAAETTARLTPNQKARRLHYREELAIRYKDGAVSKINVSYTNTMKYDYLTLKPRTMYGDDLRKLAENAEKTPEDVRCIEVTMYIDFTSYGGIVTGVDENYEVEFEMATSYEALHTDGLKSTGGSPFGAYTWGVTEKKVLMRWFPDEGEFERLAELDLEMKMIAPHMRARDPRYPWPGDLNRSGRPDAGDITILAAHIKGLRPLSEDDQVCADVDIDGEVTTADITALAAAVKGLRPLY